MLFGRHRTPFERVLAREPRDRFESGLYDVRSARGDSPRSPLSLVQPPSLEDEFEGLDRLDREELDED
ncbi:MAG TPA: hypothetical protein VF765_06700 [Polyangiaceae bacterium]